MKLIYPLIIVAAFILSGCTLVLDTTSDSIDTNDKVNRTNIKSAYSSVFEAVNNWPVK
jgi:PBP1b-binding outer membrane lipoprotein LpoB